MVVVFGDWLPEGEELSVRRFDPALARIHHGVIRTIQVDVAAVGRTVKA